MNRLDKNYILFILILLSICSCKKKINRKTEVITTNVQKETRGSKKNECLNDINLIDLAAFYEQILDSCQKGNDISFFLSSKVRKRYGANFCELVIVSNTEKDSKIEYEIIQEGNECIGLININSINYTKIEGYKKRNEYSTYFIVKKEENIDNFKIKEVGGAG